MNACRESLRDEKGWTIVYGHAAAEIVPCPDKLIYADMARWEIQMRSRRKEVNGLGVETGRKPCRTIISEDILLIGLFAII